VVGAVAALVASSVMDTLLGLDRGQRGRWLRYDAETLTLEEHTITPREDCPVCGDGAGEKPCHPIPDS
jgi:bacteriocin biosynthesis cyclodehydratase domain-containing protein